LGEKDILGTTEKVAEAASPVMPVTVSVLAAASLPATTTKNEPVARPPEMLHEGGGTKAIGVNSPPPVQLRMQAPVSPVLNPLPLKLIVSPPLPLFGVNVLVGTVTVKNAETVP
jgi:hypothetical protein